MISETEPGQVSKEIPGSGSGLGTRWALHVSRPWMSEYLVKSSKKLLGALPKDLFLTYGVIDWLDNSSEASNLMQIQSYV